MATLQVVILNFKKFVLIWLFCALFVLVQLEFSWTFIQNYFALIHHTLMHNTSTGVQNEI